MYLDFIIRPSGFSSVPHPQSYIFMGACGGPLTCNVPREQDMILKEFSQILAEELGARRPAPGDASRPVRGLSVEEPADGWLGPNEVAVTSRETLDEGFLKGLGENGSPGVVWRSGAEPSPEAVELARALGLGLFVVPPEVPLRRLFSLISGGEGLLRISHGTGRALLESVGAETSLGDLTARISDLLGRPVVVEDPVGRLISSSPAADSEGPNARPTFTDLGCVSRSVPVVLWRRTNRPNAY